MKRFVLQQLIEWKNREDRKPLILTKMLAQGDARCISSRANRLVFPISASLWGWK